MNILNPLELRNEYMYKYDNSNITLVVGGAGTGKTWLVKKVIDTKDYSKGIVVSPIKDEYTELPENFEHILCEDFDSVTNCIKEFLSTEEKNDYKPLIVIDGISYYKEATEEQVEDIVIKNIKSKCCNVLITTQYDAKILSAIQFYCNVLAINNSDYISTKVFGVF